MNAGLAMLIGFTLGVVMMLAAAILMLRACKVSSVKVAGAEVRHDRG